MIRSAFSSTAVCFKKRSGQCTEEGLEYMEMVKSRDQIMEVGWVAKHTAGSDKSSAL